MITCNSNSFFKLKLEIARESSMWPKTWDENRILILNSRNLSHPPGIILSSFLFFHSTGDRWDIASHVFVKFRNNLFRSTLSTHFTTPKFVICPHLSSVRGKKVQLFIGLCDNSQQPSTPYSTTPKSDEKRLPRFPFSSLHLSGDLQKKEVIPSFLLSFCYRSLCSRSKDKEREEEKKFHSNSQTQQNHSALLHPRRDPLLPERKRRDSQLETLGETTTQHRKTAVFHSASWPVVIRRFSFVWKHPP